MFEDKNKENTSGLAKLFRRKEKEEGAGFSLRAGDGGLSRRKN